MVHPARRIYLDNAATSFPKPESVVRAMVEFATEIGASPGRGSYAESMRGAQILAACRERVRRLIGGASARHIVFTLNCSDALNLAIHGLLRGAVRRGGRATPHVVTTVMDHNSVLRPLRALEAEGVAVTRVGADAVGWVDPAGVVAAIRPETVLVAMVHASNVTGTVQDVAAVGEACRRRGVPLLVDAAQSLGHLPVDVEAMGIDLLAFPGHKGLLGPLGTGGLAIRPGLEERLEPIRQGGTGSRSESDRHPCEMPDRYEAGSHNTLGIAGLLAGVEWVLQRGVEAVRAHEIDLMGEFLEHFRSEEAGLELIGPGSIEGRVGVFSVTHPGVAPGVLAAELERRSGVLTRAGLHCAPGAHAAVGTAARGGTCRLSLGPLVTGADVRAACACLGEIGRDVLAGRPAGRSGAQERLGSSIQPASV